MYGVKRRTFLAGDESLEQIKFTGQKHCETFGF